MSLFQAKNYWNASTGAEEESDTGCLCVANIDNEASAANKIITATLTGMLRIYRPAKREYKIEDLCPRDGHGRPHNTGRVRALRRWER